MKSLNTIILVIFAMVIVACGKNESSEQKVVVTPTVNIHMAALQGNVEAIQQHIAYGSDINQKDDYGSCPLTVATTFGKTEVADLLINAGADLTVKNNDGSTPLHIAAFMCRTDIVKSLLEKGADKTITNNYGHTALQSVSGPFEAARPIYEGLEAGLKPLGLYFDYAHLEKTRPIIAELLK